MQIFKKKTKVMVFNPRKAWDFQPALSLDNQELDMVEEMRLLGVVIQTDLKWTSNTEQMVVKGYIFRDSSVQFTLNFEIRTSANCLCYPV